MPEPITRNTDLTKLPNSDLAEWVKVCAMRADWDEGELMLTETGVEVLREIARRLENA